MGNFEDEKLLRKLISKGVKHDKQWEAAYKEYCSSRGVAQGEEKSQPVKFIATFIERNLGNSINQEWVQRILHPEQFMDAPMEKPDKKEKKKKCRRCRRSRWCRKRFIISHWSPSSSFT